MTEKTLEDQVREFQAAFNQPAPEVPAFPDAETWRLRERLIDEELRELKDAYAAGDFVEMVDALADLLYVVQGAAITVGVHMEPVMAEVHRTNMAKVGGPIDENGKQLKPPGWTPPDIEACLERQGWSPAESGDCGAPDLFLGQGRVCTRPRGHAGGHLFRIPTEATGE